MFEYGIKKDDDKTFSSENRIQKHRYYLVFPLFSDVGNGFEIKLKQKKTHLKIQNGVNRLCVCKNSGVEKNRIFLCNMHNENMLAFNSLTK